MSRHEKAVHSEIRRSMDLDVDNLDIDLVNMEDSNEFVEISEIEIIGDNEGFDSADLINSSNDKFNINLKHFLSFLDRSIDWSSSCVQEVLDSFIQKCGHEPIRNSQLDESDRLRANLNLLLTVNEETKDYLIDHSVDDVLFYLIHSKLVDS